ncbi:hypothetical protein [Dactylosporangium sp. CA-233914]
MFDSANNAEGKPDVARKLIEDQQKNGKPCANTLTLTLPMDETTRTT